MNEPLPSLTDCRRAPGFEADRREKWLSAIPDADRVWTDAYGDAAATFDREAPTVVVDQIPVQLREGETGVLYVDVGAPGSESRRPVSIRPHAERNRRHSRLSRDRVAVVRVPERRDRD